MSIAADSIRRIHMEGRGFQEIAERTREAGAPTPPATPVPAPPPMPAQPAPAPTAAPMPPQPAPSPTPAPMQGEAPTDEPPIRELLLFAEEEIAPQDVMPAPLPAPQSDAMPAPTPAPPSAPAAAAPAPPVSAPAQLPSAPASVVTPALPSPPPTPSPVAAPPAPPQPAPAPPATHDSSLDAGRGLISASSLCCLSPVRWWHISFSSTDHRSCRYLSAIF